MLAVRKLSNAPRVNGLMPYGPSNKPASFAEVTRLAKDGNVTAATRVWNAMARQEWAGLTGTDLKFKHHRFSWASACGRIAHEQPGTSFASRLWRFAATTAKETESALRNDKRSGHAQRLKAALGHAKDLQRRTDDKLATLSEEDRAAVRGWNASFQAAVTARSTAWCASLAAVARK